MQELGQAVAALKARVDQVIVDGQGDGLGSSYLGPSLLGKDCDRATWYRWRWYSQVRHKASLLRLFDRGNREEDRIVGRLRDAGIAVWQRDADGNQYGGQDLDGHLRWRSDGVVGIGDWPPGLLECKTMNAKNYAALLRDGQPPRDHADQMHLYMLYMGLPWGLYIAACKDNDDWFWAGLPYDANRAEFGRIQASNLLAASRPPERIASTPAFYPCKWCDHAQVCHHGAEPVRSCRSCAHGSPVADGKWACAVLPTYAIRTPQESRKRRKPRNHMPCQGLQWQRIQE